MIEIIILAIALSMDAFAVSLTMGVRNTKRIQKLALLAGLYFGFFQGLMPLFGYLGGVAIVGWLGNFTHLIAFILLITIGLKMIYEAAITKPEENPQPHTYSHYALLLLAIATSIDAFAAGFSLTLMSINGIYACILIGLITFIFSYVGIRIGRRVSYLLGNKAEILGGVVLVILGFKVLLI
ncbi:MAG: putative Mn2+ efflux pump MntP [Patiriisocius sp.]|jgi:putative Mn2+ efflux pump MntP